MSLTKSIYFMLLLAKDSDDKEHIFCLPSEYGGHGPNKSSVNDISMNIYINLFCFHAC